MRGLRPDHIRQAGRDRNTECVSVLRTTVQWYSSRTEQLPDSFQVYCGDKLSAAANHLFQICRRNGSDANPDQVM